MPKWDDVEKACPEIAARARARIEATGLALLATLRADGSPRISAVEPFITSGELYLGMMDGSRKAADLLRDPRFSLHNATEDKDVKEGDVKLSGRTIEVTSRDEVAAFLKAFSEANDYGPSDDDPMHLFRCDVTMVSTLVPAGDHLDIDTWTVDGGVAHVDRY